MVSLFDPLPEDARIPRAFRVFFEGPKHAPARRLIDELYVRFPGANRGFRNDFRGEGFSAALFELFTFAALEEAQYTVTRQKRRPDFHALRGAEALFVEATTTNPSDRVSDQGPTTRALLEPRDQGPILASAAGRDELCAHLERVETAIRKKAALGYSTLEWVAGRPVALSIAPFHGDKALLFPQTFVMHLLYGDVFPELPLKNGPVFNDTTLKDISAVMFTNSATTAKFNRMAIERGYGSAASLVPMRFGRRYTFVEHGWSSAPFRYLVEPKPDAERELWSHDVFVFHNPNATHALDLVLADAMELKRLDGKPRFPRIPRRCVAISATTYVRPDADAGAATLDADGDEPGEM